jgi:hypothetical protein
MLAFLESALLQSEQAQNNDSMTGDFDQRIGSLMKPEGSLEPEPEMAEAAPKAPGLAAVLLELVNIAAQIARVDQMIAQVTNGAPDADEAKRWHEISLQALRCSRDMLSQKQAECLAGLRGSSPEATPATMEIAPPPGLSQTETPTWMGSPVEAIPEFVPEVKTLESGGGSLRRDLEVLRERNPERVLIVRKIKKLGFESPTLLTEHFQQYGQVAEVLVAHSHVRPTPKRPNGRVRPAALGFMVMASEEAAQSALQAGVSQAVCGVVIEVGSFESFDCFYDAADQEEEK